MLAGRPSPLPRAALAALAALTIALAGCGGGGSDDAAWRSEADALCRRATAEKAQLELPQTADELEGYVESLIEVSRDFRDGWASLTPPKDKEVRVGKLIALLDADQRLGEKLLAAVRDRNAARVVAYRNTLEAQGREESRLLRELGCSPDKA